MYGKRSAIVLHAAKEKVGTMTAALDKERFSTKGLTELVIGEKYESKDWEGKWWSCIVKEQNYDGSFTVDVTGEKGQKEWMEWDEVWPGNCRHIKYGDEDWAVKLKRDEVALKAAAEKRELDRLEVRAMLLTTEAKNRAKTLMAAETAAKAKAEAESKRKEAIRTKAEAKAAIAEAEEMARAAARLKAEADEKASLTPQAKARAAARQKDLSSECRHILVDLGKKTRH